MLGKNSENSKHALQSIAEIPERITGLLVDIPPENRKRKKSDTEPNARFVDHFFRTSALYKVGGTAATECCRKT